MNTRPRSTGQEHPHLPDFEKAAAHARETFAALPLSGPLSGPVSLATIQNHLESVRGRRIVIREIQVLNDTSICGLWFGLEDVDMIFHAATTGQVHRQQIVLHEFSHILLNHEHEEYRAEVFGALFPELEPDTVVRALLRSREGSPREMAAEVLADLLADRIRVSSSHAGHQPHRFGEVFG